MTASEFTLVIPGQPRGKGRPRHGSGRTFTPRETVLAENDIRHAWQEAGEPRLPDGPVELAVTASVTRPDGHYLRDGSLSANGRRHLYPHRQKPDFDNFAKLIADSLNTRAWRDDVQIVSATIERVWDDLPRTTVRARALPCEVTE